MGSTSIFSRGNVGSRQRKDPTSHHVSSKLPRGFALKTSIIASLFLFLIPPVLLAAEKSSSKKFEFGSDQERKQFEERRSRCFQGLAAACNEAAEIELARGRIEGARNFYATGCKTQDAQSCLGLGKIYERTGHMNDAKLVYKQACEARISSGCLQWSRMEYHSNHPKEGARILREACEKRAYSDACKVEDEIRKAEKLN
jgi:hypothetical protein